MVAGRKEKLSQAVQSLQLQVLSNKQQDTAAMRNTQTQSPERDSEKCTSGKQYTAGAGRTVARAELAMLLARTACVAAARSLRQ